MQHDDAASVMSFTSSIHSVPAAAEGQRMRNRHEAIEAAKVEGVNALVAMLGCRDLEKMSLTFEAMSSSPDNCELMRSNRVVPVLVGVLHGHGGQEVSKLMI